MISTPYAYYLKDFPRRGATVALGKKKHDIITTARVIITSRTINKTLEGEGSVPNVYVYAAEDFHQSKWWKTKNWVN